MAGADSHDQEALLELVGEAVAWCLPRASLQDPAGSLRELPDPVSEVGLLNASTERIVEAVTWARRRRLATSPSVVADHDLADGRLLAYFPDEELADGAAEQATDGFFDTHNAPPWNSWVAQVSLASERVLLSYVPAVLVPLVAKGIDVNPEACIRWV